MSTGALNHGLYFWPGRDKLSGFMASLVFHVILLTVGGALLIKPIEYGVEKGLGGMEIQLIAAAAEQTVVAEVVERQIQREEIPITRNEDIVIAAQPKVVEAPKEIVKQKNVLTAVEPLVKGDGSSLIAGENETSFHTKGGALSETRPAYLKNPAPAYPWEAKKKGWEGTVMLNVVVDKEGNTVDVNVERSSGHALLDKAALNTVKKWKFKPAQIGSIPVESSVNVPIRFELEEG